ncbi:ADP-ribosylglycohydrolase (macronuclear) [Tetrahymena thermophila SB210]|uniref:ADP-ribosylglycohydrolase n=1 Tax=Tetrahymena thermophila (strain SB210) TaxID=312017 RepID=Q22C47_TETTS|nr:ADP-ribosylglycohydrolase [Tetrahymena thermophila SB210]EAR82865.1 ADP-ribosylglycohydrolase [Tetrahymena thermophila SB210]|eukprot:XP_001030528.1 ADP-ribosylglycohydrolase [Tetrahymena thermophila SB210]
MQKQNLYLNSQELKFNLSPEDVQVILKNQNNSDQEKRAIGCMMCSYIGDSIGTVTEFTKDLTEEQIQKAIRMEGGGIHRVIAGQGTDDSELATSLGYGLIESDENSIDLNLITKYYVLWVKSKPIDIGQTTSNPFKLLINDQQINIKMNKDQVQEKDLSNIAISQAQIDNQNSESNGGCMRICSLIVYLSKLNDQEEIKKSVFSEQQITHPNIISQYCTYIYVRACINLIQNGDAKKAFEDINNYVENFLNIGVIQQWWRENVLKEKFSETKIYEVWIKHQFINVFIILKRIAEGSESIDSDLLPRVLKQIIRLHGDTDTAACIVGGMIGSLVGYQNIPSNYVNILVQCDLQNDPKLNQKRPAIYNPRACIYLSHKLYEKAPTQKVQIIGGTNEQKTQIPMLQQFYDF